MRYYYRGVLSLIHNYIATPNLLSRLRSNPIQLHSDYTVTDPCTHASACHGNGGSGRLGHGHDHDVFTPTMVRFFSDPLQAILKS